MEFDIGYLKRAGNLVADAKKKAFANKTEWAFRNYKADGPLGRIAGVAVGSFMISAAAATVGSVALAAGVAAAAVTFGIAPAVSIALTYIMAKGVGEWLYQKQSGRLKAGMDEDDGDFSINDPSLLAPAMQKVLKKLTRVHRRATQLGGGVRGAVTSVRHSLTTMRAALKNTRLGRKAFITGSTMFASEGLASTDHELSDRLYEIRFYAQMLFNYVREIIDRVAVVERDGVVDMCELVFDHLVRQVHFSGNHTHCKHCYGMSDRDVQKRIADFERQARTPGTSKGSFEVDAAAAREFFARQNVAQRIGSSEPLFTSLQTIQANVEDDERKMAKTLNDNMTRWGFRAAQAVPEISAAEHTIEKTGTMGKGAAHQLAQNPAAFAATTAAAAGVGAAGAVVFSEFILTVKNRLTRLSVLQRSGKAFELTQEGGSARAEAIQEFEELLRSTDVTKRGVRVATKCASYVTKLSELKEKLRPTFNKLPSQRSGARSVFSSCDEAHEFAYAMNYYFRNCEKFIAFLVYLEAILIDIDLKVASLNVGVQVGEIVDLSENASMPPKPVTVS